MNLPFSLRALESSDAITGPNLFGDSVGIEDEVFSSPPSMARLSEFVTKLEILRISLPFTAWRALCQPNARRWQAWIAFLSADPYTAHALNKLRGYPGDAAIMDFAYGHPTIQDKIASASDLGRELYDLTYAMGMSRSARQRTCFVADALSCAIAQQGPVTVASFAAGHARELEILGSDDARGIVQFTSVDTDAISQSEVARAQSGRIPVRSLNRSVFKVSADEIGPCDVVYSMGLFDYLEGRVADRVTRTMADAVKPGGTLIIGNLTEQAANIAYCEAITDWWMVLRSEAAMRALAQTLIDRDPSWTVDVTRRGCFSYILARRGR